MLHARQYAGSGMNTFTVELCSTTRQDTVTGVNAFMGEDESGSFSIWAGHERLSTVLDIGLSRFRGSDGRWRYIAAPGAVLYFTDNVLTLGMRKYWIDEDFNRITALLNEHLSQEEAELAEVRKSLRRMEEELLKRLYDLDANT